MRWRHNRVALWYMELPEVYKVD